MGCLSFWEEGALPSPSGLVLPFMLALHPSIPPQAWFPNIADYLGVMNAFAPIFQFYDLSDPAVHQVWEECGKRV